ncbi:MAG: hypothetical protein AAB438_03740, partial [Patescibacteria group bacterium]
MKSENKNCQNCKNDFVIESEDFSFYEKIKVPPPTFCPECRMKRRMLWRNSRSLHKRECMLCKKSLISMYSPSSAPVACVDCWNGDKWDPYMNAREYDFSRPFFEQLKELFQINPRFYAYKFGNLVNSEFTNFSKDNKNCYLSYSITDCEDIIYSETIDKSKNSMDSLAVTKIDGCSYNIDCEGNYNTHYAVQSNSCIDSYFIFDCANCNNCCLSSNLRNQQYVFKNQKLSKEEYKKALEDLHLETISGFENTKKEFDNLIINEAIHKYAFIYASQDVTGDYIHNARNVKDSFDVNDVENVRYSNRVIGVKDCIDNSGVGFGAELIYESMAATANTYKDFFCYLTIQGCRECEYSMILKNCANCFGCVGLTNAKFCIFNKQYEEKEYHEIVAKIKEHMTAMPYVDEKGRVFKYGEFFPYDMSPFGYNETNAHDIFPITKEEVLSIGYPWKDKEKKDYNPTIQSMDLPNNINNVNESIVNEIISCPGNGDVMTQCTTAFKITPAELQFLKLKNLPLPTFCPNCRHYQRLKYRNSMHLYDRGCMKSGCENTFKTT